MPAPPQPGSSDRGDPDRHGALPSSRVGGAILLAVIVAAVIVAVVLLADGGGSSRSATTTATGTSAAAAAGGTSTAPKGASGASGPSENARLALTSPDPVEQGGRRRRDPLGRRQARLLSGRRTPAAIHGLLLRGLAVQLPHELRGAQQEPRRSAPKAPSRAARCCPPTPASTTRCCSPARPATGPPIRARSCSAARSISVTERHQLARVHDPGRVELGLQRAQRRDALLAHLARHPRRVVAPDRVVVGDRAAAVYDRSARRVA